MSNYYKCLRTSLLALATGVSSYLAPHAIAADGETRGFLPILFLSTPASPQEAEELELSAVSSYFDGRERDVALSLAIGYGLTERLTVEAELPYAIQNPSSDNEESGFGNIGLNALYCFYQTPTTLVSAYGELHIPTASGTGELGANTIEFEVALLASERFGDFEIDGSVGCTFARGERSELTYSTAGSYFISPVWAVLEMSGSTGGDSTLFLVPGLVWANETFEIGLGVPVGLTEESEPWGVLLEVTYVF